MRTKLSKLIASAARAFKAVLLYIGVAIATTIAIISTAVRNSTKVKAFLFLYLLAIFFLLNYHLNFKKN